MRALAFALMAKGESRISNPLHSPDTYAMIEAIRQLGAEVETGEQWTVQGVDGRPQVADDVIDCGNSGQILRFVAALAALSGGWTVLSGDLSVRRRRTASALIDGICQLGGEAFSTRGDGYAPICVRGPMRAGQIVIDGSASQPISALLIAASFLEGETEIATQGSKERAWVDMTLSWLQTLGVDAMRLSTDRYQVSGRAQIRGFEAEIPADCSAAAFPAALKAITGAAIEVDWPDDPAQGDRTFADLLEAMGPQRKGIEVDLDGCIDALPILAVVGCYATSEMRLRNGAIARKKESDRIAAIAEQLRRMGADLDELDDGLVIRPSELKGADLSACGDHRIAMALIVAAICAKGESRISGAHWIEKSYPHFIAQLNQLGANIE